MAKGNQREPGFAGEKSSTSPLVSAAAISRRERAERSMAQMINLHRATGFVSVVLPGSPPFRCQCREASRYAGGAAVGFHSAMTPGSRWSRV